MKVILSNFRHYAGGERFTWRFEAGKAYHVGGNSGRGKSTIFNAIYWCLYGKEERVVPFTDPSAKTWVSIKDLSPAFPLIQRSCNPARFSLKVGGSGKMLQGSPAQLHLIAHFGCADTWLATHYMRQLSLTHLLALPATKRMKVVSQLPIGDMIHFIYFNNLTMPSR